MEAEAEADKKFWMEAEAEAEAKKILKMEAEAEAAQKFGASTSLLWTLKKLNNCFLQLWKLKNCPRGINCIHLRC